MAATARLAAGRTLAAVVDQLGPALDAYAATTGPMVDELPEFEDRFDRAAITGTTIKFGATILEQLRRHGLRDLSGGLVADGADLARLEEAELAPWLAPDAKPEPVQVAA